MTVQPERNPITTDGPGHPIISISTRNGEHLRLTYVTEGYTGRPTVRFEIVDANNHRRPGPEVPIECMGEVAEAISKLMVEQGHW